MEFTKDTVVKSFNDAPTFAQAKGKLFGFSGDYLAGERGEKTLEQLLAEFPTWDLGDIILGLNRLQEVASGGIQYVYPVYSAEQIMNDPQRNQVQLFYLPAKNKQISTYAILLSGGGYFSVCTLGESLPVAAKLNDMGISCFCLNYRTIQIENIAAGVLPKPLEDLAAAWHFIKQNETAFEVDANDYIVGGFSAGGHTAALWGTQHIGYKSYDIPAPKMLMLAYPLLSAANLPEDPGIALFCQAMFGQGYTEETIAHYSVVQNVDDTYPKTYLIQNADDDTVPVKDSEEFEKAAKEVGVECFVERHNTGGHGFGLGSACEANGWVERAMTFLKLGSCQP